MRSLPGAAKYKQQTIIRPCSVEKCGEQLGRDNKMNGPAHYHTAIGLSFCMSHRQRYLLVELAQRLYPKCYASGGTLVSSGLRVLIGLAMSGDEKAVTQCLEDHKEDCAKWHIDEGML